MKIKNKIFEGWATKLKCLLELKRILETWLKISTNTVCWFKF